MRPSRFARGLACLLLAAGAHVSDAEPMGASPLVVALMNGHGTLAALLLEQGARHLDTTLYRNAASHKSYQKRNPEHIDSQ